MSIVQYGDWVIESDIAKTIEYYRQYSLEDTSTQVYRNFQKYCETLSAEEKQFFASFGLDPFKCQDNRPDGWKSNKNMPVWIRISGNSSSGSNPDAGTQTGSGLFKYVPATA